MTPGTLPAEAAAFGLTLVRMSAAALSVPGLGGAQVPSTLRVLLALTLTVLLYPVLPPVRLQGDLLGLAVAVVWEMLVGMGLGAAVSAALYAALAAGSAVDMQVGLANASLLDPGGTGSQPLLASFYHGLMVLAMFASDAHLGIVQGIALSFQWLPLAAPTAAGASSLAHLVMQSFAGFFLVTLSLMLPVMVGMLGIEVVTAFMSRTMPHVNMLLAAAPLRIVAGWFLVGVSLPVTLRTMDHLLDATVARLVS